VFAAIAAASAAVPGLLNNVADAGCDNGQGC
jgi:hypothetical protein